MKQSLKLEAKMELQKAEKVKAIFNFSGGIDSTAIYYLIREYNIDIKTIAFNKSVENPYNIAMIDSIKDEFEEYIELKGYINYKQIVYKYGHPIKNKSFSELCYRVRKIDIKNYKDVYKVITGHKPSDIDNDIFKEPLPVMFLPLKYWYLAKNYPIQTSCCRILKKAPAKKYNRPKILGLMKADSFERRKVLSKESKDFYPLTNWTKDDIFEYLKDKEYSKAYKDRLLPNGEIIVGSRNTGCIGCHYGNTVDNYYIDTKGKKHKTTKFENLKREKPRLFNNILNYKHSSGITFKETLEAYDKSARGELMKESAIARNWYIDEVLKYLDKNSKAYNFLVGYRI